MTTLDGCVIMLLLKDFVCESNETSVRKPIIVPSHLEWLFDFSRALYCLGISGIDVVDIVM